LSVKVKILMDLGRYPHITLEQKHAVELLECLSTEYYSSRDLVESIRIIENFDEFYRIVKRKFEEYLTPSKDQKEVLSGKSIVHKLRLFRVNGTNYVELIFDRRFDLNALKHCLSKLGYSDIEVVEEYA